MSKSNTEKKLLKHLSKNQALEAELQLVFPIKVFAAIEELARAHLAENRQDHSSRERVSKLAFTLRQETYLRFGHESLETILLGKLLRPATGGWKQPAPRLDSISYMRTYPKNHRLNAQQEAAAEMIKKVWEAFGRFRFIGARNLETGGMGGGGQALQPLDVMGDEIWDHYKKYYIPWYKMASVISVHRKRYAPGAVSLAAISFRVLVEDFFPEEIDSSFGLVKGSAYRGLRAALDAYYEPDAFNTFLKGAMQPQDAPSAPAASKAP